MYLRTHTDTRPCRHGQMWTRAHAGTCTGAHMHTQARAQTGTCTDRHVRKRIHRHVAATPPHVRGLPERTDDHGLEMLHRTGNHALRTQIRMRTYKPCASRPLQTPTR